MSYTDFDFNHSSSGRIAGFLLALFADLILAGSAHAQEILDSYPIDMWKSTGSKALDTLDDLDGDGIPEFLLGDVGWSGGKGKAVLRSGASGAVLKEFVGSAGAGLGWYVGNLGDVDGDGTGDFGISGILETTIWSGKDFSLICTRPRTVVAPIAALGDLDGDGYDDYLLGTPLFSYSGGGYAEVFLGGGCGPPHLVLFPPPGIDWYGHVAAGLGDVSGDGVPDFAVGAPGQDLIGVADTGYVGVYSGADGSLIWEAFGEKSCDQFGYTLAVPGDVNGDGIHDLVVGARRVDIDIPVSLCKLGANGFGRLYFFDGQTGVLLFKVVGYPTYKGLGLEITAAGDVNGNGVPDIAARAANISFFPSEQEVWWIEGATGDLLLQTINPHDSIYHDFAAALTGIGDVNSDDFPDLLVGSPTGTGVPLTIDAHLDLYSSKPVGIGVIGTACPTAAGEVPRIGVSGVPRIGEALPLHLSRVLPDLPALLALGLSQSTWHGVPLPLDLGLLGLPGCGLFVSLHALLPAVTEAVGPGKGAATLVLPVPADPSWVGATVYAQWLVVNPPGSPSLVATTRGLAITFQ